MWDLNPTEPSTETVYNCVVDFTDEYRKRGPLIFSGHIFAAEASLANCEKWLKPVQQELQQLLNGNNGKGFLPRGLELCQQWCRLHEAAFNQVIQSWFSRPEFHKAAATHYLAVPVELVCNVTNNLQNGVQRRQALLVSITLCS